MYIRFSLAWSFVVIVIGIFHYVDHSFCGPRISIYVYYMHRLLLLQTPHMCQYGTLTQTYKQSWPTTVRGHAENTQIYVSLINYSLALYKFGIRFRNRNSRIYSYCWSTDRLKISLFLDLLQQHVRYNNSIYMAK